MHAQSYRPTSADLDPHAEVYVTADGRPHPTGYFPDRSSPQQGRADWSPVWDDTYGPSRFEAVGGELVDQHPYLQVSATWQPYPEDERPSGHDDPLADGLPAPTPRLLSLWFMTARGSSRDQYDDVPGRQFPQNGSQDGCTWVYYQDPVRALAPYDPAPDSGGQMPDTLRALPPSPAHGWASQPVMVAQQWDRMKMDSLPQQRGVNQNRLANSTYAGQSYGSRTAHVGDLGSGQTMSRRSRG